MEFGYYGVLGKTKLLPGLGVGEVVRVKLEDININKQWGFEYSSRVGISALRLHHQIGNIYAIVADTNELYAIAGFGALERNKNERI